MKQPDEMPVVIRKNEYCERCGAKNPYRKYCTKTEGVDKMQYARCRKCGVCVKIYWTD